jgi:hypothetical protein
MFFAFCDELSEVELDLVFIMKIVTKLPAAFYISRGNV